MDKNPQGAESFHTPFVVRSCNAPCRTPRTRYHGCSNIDISNQAGIEPLVMEKPLSAIQPYVLAVCSVAMALGGALLTEHFHMRDVEVPLFLFAVAVTAWYGSAWAAALALLLSTASFDYFFTEPLHTLYVSSSDIPYFLVFATFASLVTWFSTVRRRGEGDLRQARDKLEIEVAERTQQANLLNLTHDSIFVRDMDFVISYWNRGAQELYGWKPEVKWSWFSGQKKGSFLDRAAALKMEKSQCPKPARVTHRA